MERQCLLQSDGCTVVVSGGPDDDLTSVVQAAHSEFNWLQKKERAQVFANHR
jgi:hypothetical protein